MDDLLKVYSVLSLWGYGEVFYHNSSSKLHFIPCKFVGVGGIKRSHLFFLTLAVTLDHSVGQMPKCNINVFFFSVSKKRNRKEKEKRKKKHYRLGLHI